MALIRRRPISSLFSIQDEINRIFEDFLTRRPEGELPGEAWYPQVDVSETEDEVIVSAELPGLRREDMGVDVRENTLTLSGEKRREKEEEGVSYHRVERIYGSFHRALNLPAAVEANKAKANFKDGVLTVKLPKVEEVRARQITIE